MAAAVFFFQGAAPGRLGAAQLGQRPVDAGQRLAVVLARHNVAVLPVKGFQHPLVLRGAHTVADSGVDLPHQQGLGHLVVIFKVDGRIGKVLTFGKFGKAAVAVVACARKPDQHTVVAVVITRGDAAIARLDGKHGADAAGGLGGVGKALLPFGVFAHVDDDVHLAVFQHLQHTVGVLVKAAILVGEVIVLCQLLQNVIIVAAGATLGVVHIIAVVAVKSHAQMLGSCGGRVGRGCRRACEGCRKAQQHAQGRQKGSDPFGDGYPGFHYGAPCPQHPQWSGCCVKTLRLQLGDSLQNLLVRLLHRRPKRGVGQGLGAAHGVGQRGGGLVQGFQTQVLGYALEGVGGAEGGLPVLGGQGGFQLGIAGVGGVFQQKLFDKSLAGQAAQCGRVVAADERIEFLQSHDDFLLFCGRKTPFAQSVEFRVSVMRGGKAFSPGEKVARLRAG